MKTKQIVAAYGILSGSKLTKMSGEGKIKVVKVIKALKPVTTEFEDFRKDAIDRLKPEGFDGMAKKAEQWQKEGDATTLTAAERAELNQFFGDYQHEVEKCLEEEAEKEHAMTFARLTGEEFQQFADSNDFTAGQLIELMDLISE